MSDNTSLWFLSAVTTWNNFAWLVANLVLAYVAIMLVVFVIGYYALFDPKATTAGRYIFRFFVSLIAVVAMVFVGLFVDPQGATRWDVIPNDIAVWRPTVRLIGYLYVAFSITSLAILLVIRKWFPHKILTALDRDLVQLTREQHSI